MLHDSQHLQSTSALIRESIPDERDSWSTAYCIIFPTRYSYIYFFEYLMFIIINSRDKFHSIMPSPPSHSWYNARTSHLCPIWLSFIRLQCHCPPRIHCPIAPSDIIIQFFHHCLSIHFCCSCAVWNCHRWRPFLTLRRLNTPNSSKCIIPDSFRSIFYPTDNRTANIH